MTSAMIAPYSVTQRRLYLVGGVSFGDVSFRSVLEQGRL